MTGASILVALFVIVASEMFSGSDAHRADEAASVADNGPPLRSYTMDLGDSNPDQSALAPKPATAPATVVESAPEAQTQAAAQDSAPAPAEVAPAEVAPPPVEDPRPAPRPAPAEPARADGWWVQVGSFSQSANAERVVRELAAAGIAARVFSIRSNGKELFRVRAGPVADRSAADALRKRLVEAGHKGSVIPP